MDLEHVLGALEKAGTAQNRKVYGRHGVQGPQFGVSFAELNRLRKTIGTAQALACGLWETGNHDARVLATMVADPAALGGRDLDGWARDLDSYVIADAFASLVARSPHALAKVRAWKDRKAEFTAAAAWNVLSHLALDSAADLPDQDGASFIEQIEAEIHDRPNRVRHSMNQALISLGVRNPALEKLALAAADRIGKVAVDHGETSCKTSDAAAYIRKSLVHRAGKRSR